ncbi:N-6 DNA methylase [Rhodococcus triatomae]|uniref:site-specific DNA-methyltransferase (adenine-specific) n=1 Tax=Rhodococcus triatomae TaxID=300028 RepID=A0A1G8PXY6_9NOCA|nr:N-6 DNA methylase [Rhodococcus triatomae]QNG19238.1 N-6 DNA methylase [Rhodococcus triatomae]QNG24849.1 N-6 DNA methylase [Rhodococcus triatomae]SDI97085.1 N-6 DNA Methylase [Rhodococcus triatomae]
MSLARALAVGGLSRLDPRRRTVDIWDPAAGLGFAGFLLVEALQLSGLEVRYRGQDIDEAAVSASVRRFEAIHDAEIAQADTLAHDAFEDFSADLVIVDAPWGMDWRGSVAAVEARQSNGEFRFGLPQHSDSTWLFISLALEKLRSAEQGGGRVAALVNPGALSSGGATAAVRQRIIDAGLLESVTRLPDGLAPNTEIPLYLLTFSNKADDVRRGKAMIADLQTMFTTERRRRSIPVDAFHELESGLRTRKSGPRNRTISTRQFTRRDARLSRTTSEGIQLSWRVTAYNATAIDDGFLEARYGPDSGVSLADEPRETVDLDPSRVLGDDSRELLRDMAAKGWPSRRLSSLLAREPGAVKDSADAQCDRQLFLPATGGGRAATELHETNASGRVLSVQFDDNSIYLPFIAAWLNSEQGIASRNRAIENGSSGHHIKALRLDANSLVRWADELLVPVPDLGVQLALASADERLGSFQAELSSQRASIWSAPEIADNVVTKIAGAFDDSLTAWLDQLPYPIASALWTAESAQTVGEKQRAYLHAWEAIVTFHATVLLSASRSDPGSSTETEAAIRQTLHEQRLGIENASFGTWVVIVERTAKDLRSALKDGDADEVARVRRAFADLGHAGIERLVSKDVVKKFNELNGKRNRWSGHTGYTSEQKLRTQVDSLVSDLRELRGLLGNVWSQLLLVRPGSAKRRREGLVQTAEVATGTRTPFAAREFVVGEHMYDDELYLVRDGSQSPLRLGHFVQLRAAPSSAQFTTYFYNRTDGASVRMVSYQYGPESELQDDLERFRDVFGALVLE